MTTLFPMVFNIERMILMIRLDTTGCGILGASNKGRLEDSAATSSVKKGLRIYKESYQLYSVILYQLKVTMLRLPPHTI